MNIIGIDIGNKATKIYNISNSTRNIIEGNSKRYMTSAISFNPEMKCRHFSDDAITKIISCSNTITNIPSKLLNYTKTFKFDKNRYSLSGNHIYIMFINYIYRHLIHKHNNQTILNQSTIIIPFPDYYNRTESNTLRDIYSQSMFNQCNIKYIPHSVAIGLEYGIYKSNQNIFNSSDTFILFIDISHSSISFYIIKYNKSNMVIDRTYHMRDNGSDYLDKELLKYIVSHIANGDNKHSIYGNDKALKKLLINMENIRKNLNMFESTILHIDSLYDGIDLNMEIKKQDYISLYQGVLNSFKNIVKIIIKNYDIDEIELLGGFSRYSHFTNIISDIIQHNTNSNTTKPIINKTLNAEETIAKGACLYGSVISSEYKNINYGIKYQLSHNIYIVIDSNKGLKCDNKIILSNEILPLNKNIIKKYEVGTTPRLSTKNISIQIYYGDENKPIYNIKHKASSLINKLSINLIVGVDLYINVKSISYTTTSNKKFNIKWNDDTNTFSNPYIDYDKIFREYDEEYENKMKLINTFEEYVYKIDETKKENINKQNPEFLNNIDHWLLNEVYKISYKECLSKIESFTKYLVEYVSRVC
mgnify:CR=1 FL=1